MKHDDTARSTETLARVLARLRAELANHHAPARVRDAVLSRWSHRTAPALQLAGAAGTPALPRRWAPWTAAALCGLLLAASLALLLREPRRIAIDEPRTPWHAGAGFVPVASADRWPARAAGSDERRSSLAWLVRVELPRERLAEFGLPFDPARAAETVKTEMLVRANGEVLALRLLAETPQQ